MRKYLCVRDFRVDDCDEEGFVTGKTMHIKVGDIYERREDNARIIGGRVALENSDNWLEISEETLADMFMEITPEICLYECYCTDCGATLRLPRPYYGCCSCNGNDIIVTMYKTCGCGTTVYFDEGNSVACCENCGKNHVAPLKPCPICGKKVEVHGGNEEWTPTSFDPDSGGEPYFIECKCGLNFSIGPCEYTDFTKAWNTRAMS